MSVAARIERKVTIDEAVDLLWRAFVEDGHESYAATVIALWPSLTFDAVAYEMLAMIGLEQRFKDAKSFAIRGKNGGRPVVPHGAPHGKKWEKYIALSWPFKGADGTMKPLLDFARDDLVHFAAHAGVMQQSWRRRHEWAVATDQLCEEHGVLRIRDLPTPVIAEVDQSAREAMGRQE